MPAPAYSPTSGKGTVVGNYTFNGTSWDEKKPSGGSSNTNMQIGGWYNNPSAGGQNMRYWGDKGWTSGSDPTQGGNSNNNVTNPQVAGPSNEMNALIDNAYSSTLDAYGGVEKMYKEQATEANKGIDEQAALSKSAYQNALDQAKGVYSTQKEDLNAEQLGMKSAGIRQYNAMQQQGMSTYGRGSSVGGALSELVSQEYLRTQGDLNQKYVGAVKVIQKAEQDATTQFTMAVQDLEQKIVQARRDIGTNLQTMLGEISLKKAALEDEKRMMRLNALQTAMANAQQLEADRQSKLFDLGLWKLQRDEELGKANKTLDALAQTTNTSIGSAKTSMNSTLSNFAAKGISTQNNNVSNPLAYQNPKNVYDPYAGLLT